MEERLAVTGGWRRIHIPKEDGAKTKAPKAKAHKTKAQNVDSKQKPKTQSYSKACPPQVTQNHAHAVHENLTLGCIRPDRLHRVDLRWIM